jgi:hypothetical protein
MTKPQIPISGKLSSSNLLERALVSFFPLVFWACGTQVVASPAASLNAEIRTDSLVFHADAVVLHPSEIVRAQVTVSNPSHHASTLFVAGGCPVIFQLLSSVPPNGRTVWDSRKTRSSMGCAASMLRARIEPGESRVFVREVELTEILGDSLRVGRYYVSSQLDLWPGPAVTLYAGELVLSK